MLKCYKDFMGTKTDIRIFLVSLMIIASAFRFRALMSIWAALARPSGWDGIVSDRYEYRS